MTRMPRSEPITVMLNLINHLMFQSFFLSY